MFVAVDLPRSQAGDLAGPSMRPYRSGGRGELLCRDVCTESVALDSDVDHSTAETVDTGLPCAHPKSRGRRRRPICCIRSLRYCGNARLNRMQSHACGDSYSCLRFSRSLHRRT
jgi:hypothetical protein